MWNPISHWSVAFSFKLLAALVAASTAAWALVHHFAKNVNPPLFDLELAEERSNVNDILRAWRNNGMIETAQWAIRADFILASLYPPLAALICLLLVKWLGVPPEPQWLAYTGIVIAWVLLSCLLWDYAENVTMLHTLRSDTATSWIDATRWFGRLKYGLLALGAAYVLVWLQDRFARRLYKLIDGYVHTTAWALLTGFLIMALIQFAISRRLRPSLLMLQLAPSPAAAKRVLEKWGDDLKRTAKQATAFDLIFTLLYTCTAVLFFRIGYQTSKGSALAPPALVVAWYLLVAAALQCAQDAGVYWTLQRKPGWWSQASQIAGSARIALVATSACFGLVMLARWEGRYLATVLTSIYRLFA